MKSVKKMDTFHSKKHFLRFFYASSLVLSVTLHKQKDITTMKEFFKNLGRYKVSSVLNILGLSIAFAVAYIILVQVNHDLTYNRCFKDADRVYRLDFTSSFITDEQDEWMMLMSHALGEALGTDNSAVEQMGYMELYASLIRPSLNGKEIYVPIEGKEDELMEVHTHVGSAELPQMLGMELIAGDYSHLKKPNSILINESFAQRYGFEIDDAIRDKDNVLWTVRGIYEDLPTNCILGEHDIFTVFGTENRGWSNVYYYKLVGEEQEEVFLLNGIKKLADVGLMYELFGNTWERPSDDAREEWLDMASKTMRLTPFYESHFITNMYGTIQPQNDKSTVYILLSIAVLILVIAFINFVNFFMAMVPRRIRRVNTEKVFGCTTRRLRMNFVLEAVGLVAISLLIALYIVFMIAPELTGIISSSARIEDNPTVTLFLIVAGLLLAVVSSIYPAYYITSVPPAFALKGTFGNTASGRRLRYVLLTLQFVISIILIICSSFIRLQYFYMVNDDIGYDKEDVLTADISSAGYPQPGMFFPSWNYEQRQQLTSMLKENPQITDVTYAWNQFVTEDHASQSFHKEDGAEFSSFVYYVAHNFLQFMDIDVVDGEDFTLEDELQRDYLKYIFNETARKELDLSLNEKFMDERPIRVVGFCKDFKLRYMKERIQPFAFYIGGFAYYNYLFVRTIPAADVEEVKAHINHCIAKLGSTGNADKIKITSIEQELSSKYEHERKLNLLITIFSLISICISLMGVFGLVFFETQYRRREIAVRRVHGASINSILMMFVGQYARMVLVAFLFAMPVGYMLMSRWLEEYAYHIPLYWWVFALALLIVLAVTSGIVLVRSWKTAHENPVNSLYKE